MTNDTQRSGEEDRDAEQVVVMRDGVLDVEQSAVDSSESGPDVTESADDAGDSAADAPPLGSEEESTESDGTDTGTQRGKRRTVLVSALLVLTVVFSALAVWFSSEMYALRYEGPAANQTLVDTASTSAVNGQVTDAVQKVFSYDFANTAKTEDAAKSLLVGQAIQQYDQLFAQVKKLAPQEKMVLTTTVTSSGVTRLQGDRAQVLLFVNQNAVRTDTGQNNAGSGQITVDVVKQGNQWKIDQITER